MEAIKETLYDTLTHHGVKGQKWGVRRYQNYDGTLTAKGKERYGRDCTAGKGTVWHVPEKNHTLCG